MTAKFFSILAFLSFGTSGLAKASEYCFGYQNIQFVNRAGDVKTAPPCADFKRFDELGGKINDLLGYKNPGVDLTVKPHMSEAANSFAFDHIGIAIDGRNSDDHLFTDTVFIHEWSHAVLNRYLQDNLKLFKSYLPLLARAEEIEKIIFQFIQKLDANGACVSMECERFMAQNQNVFADEAANTEKLNEFFNSNQSAMEVATHYHELFADVVPVLYYSNLDITRQASVHFSGGEADCRSFLFSAPADFKTSEPHCSLSAVRKEIAEKIQKANTMAEKQILARKFLELTAQQIEMQFDRVSGWTRNQLQEFPDAKAISDLRAAIEKL